MKTHFSFKEIKELLPYDFPFLLIDKVIEIVKDKRIICIKNVTGNEIYFLGHFKEEAVMPGVLIIEALAQAALFLIKYGQNRKRHGYLLGSINKMRFFKPVLPGDQMIIEVKIIKVLGNSALVAGYVTVDEKIVAKGELIFIKTKKSNSSNVR